MPTIKGPIVLGKNRPIPKEILKEMKLPIKADNWQSTQSKDAIIQPKSLVKISNNIEPINNLNVSVPTKSKTKSGIKK